MKDNKWAKEHPEEANKLVIEIIEKDIEAKKVKEALKNIPVNRKSERKKKK